MKISELIEILMAVQKANGDLPVWVNHEWMEPVGKVVYYPGSDNPNCVREEVVIIEGGE